MTERKQYTFYSSFASALSKMPQGEQLGMFWAITNYALREQLPEALSVQQEIVFDLIKPTLDTSHRKSKKSTRGIPCATSGEKSKHEGEKELENELEIELENELETESKGAALGGAEGFEAFWNGFPLHIGKDKAREIWNNMLPDEKEVMQGLERWKKSRQWKKENGRFIPRAWRWLAEKQYLDHPDQVQDPIWGATGVLGAAEIESIRQVMEMDNYL